jgi:hypothetical protein
MPLDKRCSTEAFSNNVRTEHESGKEQKQAIAIAYSVLCRACGCPKDTRMTPKQMVAYAKESNMSKSEPNWEDYGMCDPAFSYKSWRLEGTPRTARDFEREAEKMKKKGYKYKLKIKLSNRVDYLYAKTAAGASDLSRRDFPDARIMPIDTPHEEDTEPPRFHLPDWALEPKQLDEDYYTVVIPWVEPKKATSWHPTEKKGPFSKLTRGSFKTEKEAHAWAKKHLRGNPYEVKKMSAESVGEGRFDEKRGTRKSGGKVSSTRWHGKSFLIKKRVGESVLYGEALVAKDKIGKRSFGEISKHLVPKELRSEWLKKVPFSSRVALLVKHRVTSKRIREIETLWREWRGF